MLSKEVEFLVKLRDALTMAAEAVNDYLETLAPKDAKQVIAEQTFNILKWECEEGTILGKFEVAYQKANIPDKWHHCYNILRNNNSLINSRFHEDGYVYAYWIYPEKYTERIFRKKLEVPQP